MARRQSGQRIVIKHVGGTQLGGSGCTPKSTRAHAQTYLPLLQKQWEILLPFRNQIAARAQASLRSRDVLDSKVSRGRGGDSQADQ
jgi:hypothetical protein